MAIITFLSPKGGVGKTTSCFVLASMLVDKGASVTLIDADPNYPIVKWQSRGGQADGLTIIANNNEEDLVTEIKAAHETSDFVIIDVEGTSNMKMTYAAALADLCIVPMQKSILDVDQAARALKLIKNASAMGVKEDAKTALLFTRSNILRTKGGASIEGSIQNRGLPHFSVMLFEREPFKTMFSESKTLGQLRAENPKNTSIEKAYLNAESYAIEALRKLDLIEDEPEDNQDNGVAA